MTKQEAIQTRIDEIMDTFDFEKVGTMMEATNWVWGCMPGHLPEERELRVEARRQLRCAVENKGMSSSGGFTAIYEDFGGSFNLWLFFGESDIDDPVEYEGQGG